MSKFYYFKCPVCGFNHQDINQLVPAGQIHCGRCLCDTNKLVELHRWPYDDTVVHPRMTGKKWAWLLLAGCLVLYGFALPLLWLPALALIQWKFGGDIKRWCKTRGFYKLITKGRL